MARQLSNDERSYAAALKFKETCAIQAEALSRARGFDPDRPRHLSKVTRTV